MIRMPEEATLYATNDFCPIAGFVVGDQVLTIQGHPNLTRSMREHCYPRKDILGESVFEAGLASLERPTDQQVLAVGLRIFQGPSEDCRSNKRLGRYIYKGKSRPGRRARL